MTWPSRTAGSRGLGAVRRSAAAGLGSSASEKYGTVAGSTSASRPRRSRSVVARSTYQASSRRPARSSASRTRSKVRPSFITAAESVPASRAASSSGGSVPGSTVRISSRSTSGRPSTADAALTEVTPGTTSVSYRWASRLCMCM